MKKIIALALLATIMVWCSNHNCNCKACQEQNKQFIKQQVDSILTEIFD